MKQEAIEEAIEEAAESYRLNKRGFVTKYDCKEGFIEGAKWQQQNSYSEEDMKKAFCNGGNLDYSVLTSTEVGNKILNKWFEQFKKK